MSFALTNSIVAESSEWTNIVQFISEAPDSRGDTSPAYCNATFIHHNVLLTAAHCLKNAYISGVRKISIQIGHYKYVTRKTDGKTVRIGYMAKYNLEKNINIELPHSLVDKIARRKDKAFILPTEDVALAWWSEETPEVLDIQMAELMTPAEHENLIKNISTIPFHVVTINSLTEKTADLKRMANLNNYKWKNYVYSKSSSRVEEGESGSPLFAQINGQTKIFAVVLGKAKTLFDNWDVYTAVNPHICQMARALPTFIKISACL